MTEMFGVPVGGILLSLALALDQLAKYREKNRQRLGIPKSEPTRPTKPCTIGRIPKAPPLATVRCAPSLPQIVHVIPPPYFGREPVSPPSLEEVLSLAERIETWSPNPMCWSDWEPSPEDYGAVYDYAERMPLAEVEVVLSLLRKAKPGEIDLNHRYHTRDFSGPNDASWVQGVQFLLSQFIQNRPAEAVPLLNEDMENEAYRTIILDSCGSDSEIISWVQPWVPRWRELNRRSLSALIDCLGDADIAELPEAQKRQRRAALLYLRSQPELPRDMRKAVEDHLSRLVH